MKYIYMFVVILCVLMSNEVHAAKAVAIVSDAGNIGNQVIVSVQVANDSNGILFTTSFTVNFTSSPNQMNADIKQRVKDEFVRMGVSITVNDIVLFGGTQ